MVEKERGGGAAAVCVSIRQTCSSNGLYYLLLFAVCCNQAPDWGLSRNRQRFSSRCSSVMEGMTSARLLAEKR